jgi:serine/threonine-protein kinase
MTARHHAFTPPARKDSGTMPVVRVRTTPPVVGEVVAQRWVVERVVAEGGFGIVVAARHVELDETVAIKFLKAESVDRPDVVGRFAREAKICARMKNEHTPTVIDVGVCPHRGPYMVMEYLEGEDLLHLVARRGPMPIAEVAEIGLQACAALASAHAAGVIHRDIKPENLFLAERPGGMKVLKLLDFGISKASLDGEVFGTPLSLVTTQCLVGTPLYMPPEQLRAKSDLGPTADLWSLGTVLYELVAARTAFSGIGVTDVCASVLETEPLRLDEVRPDVPAAFADVVARCLAKKPEARWESAAALALALAPFAPTSARIEVERAIAVSKAAGLPVPDAEPVPAASLPEPSAPAPPQPRVEMLPTLRSARVPREPRTVLIAAAVGALAASIPLAIALVALRAPAAPPSEPEIAARAPIAFQVDEPTEVAITTRPATRPIPHPAAPVEPASATTTTTMTPPPPLPPPAPSTTATTSSESLPEEL